MRRFLIMVLPVMLVGSAAAIGAPPRRQAASEKPSRTEAFEWLRNAFMQTFYVSSAKYKHENRPKEIVISSTPLRFRELRDCVVSMETETRLSGAVKIGAIEAEEVDFSALNPDVVVKDIKVEGTKDSPERIIGHSVTAYTYQLRKVVRVSVSRLPDDPEPNVPPDQWEASISFTFRTSDLVDRTARALRIAIEQCGGKREKF